MAREPEHERSKRRVAAKRARPAPASPPRAGTVALLGRPNVGKSTLLNALLGERIAITSAQPQTTRDRIAGILTREGLQIVFLDTPGFHAPKSELGARMNELASAAAADCDVAVFMTDVDPRAPGGLRSELGPADLAIVGAIPARKPTVLVINKIDRVRPRSGLLPVLEGYAKARAFDAVVPVSALKADGVERIVREVAALLPEGEPLFDPDELSDKPVRFFVAEYVREQILRRTQKEVPHGVAVTVESFDEGPKIVRIAVTVHVAKDSHKGILIGDGGKMLAAIGRGARERAEGLLGRKVFLETWVRATPGWFDSPARLAELGYDDAASARPTRRKRAPRSARSPRPKS